jgi:uncharacterized protein YodC (DUF2158 family)
MSQDFQIGDVVRLKSGGPKMTVTSVGPDGHGKLTVWCVWFPENSAKPEHGAFPAEAVER